MEIRIVKPLKTWRDSIKTFLFKTLEKFLDQRDSIKIVAHQKIAVYKGIHSYSDTGILVVCC